VNWVTVAEAAAQTSFSHEHIAALARSGKITARKGGGVWLIDLDSLKAYEQRMQELGTKKYDPTRDDHL
jgi:excisionase family DNA binding protein